jgi:hypothetical protein
MERDEVIAKADREVLTEERIRQLLELGGVPPSDEKAVTWLKEASKGAAASYRIAKQRRPAADHNALLADIEKSAKQLTNRIQRLRRYPASWRAFWRSRAFGPVRGNRVEIRGVLSTLENVMRAADAAKDRRKGRPREVGKQQVVNQAFAFFVRFSAHRPSGTSTGAFARFARAYYAAVTEADPTEHGGIDRQIRQALTRLAIERQRAQRKSAQKLRHSS